MQSVLRPQEIAVVTPCMSACTQYNSSLCSVFTSMLAHIDTAHYVGLTRVKTCAYWLKTHTRRRGRRSALEGWRWRCSGWGGCGGALGG